jgi:hypothetical protein
MSIETKAPVSITIDDERVLTYAEDVLARKGWKLVEDPKTQPRDHTGREAATDIEKNPYRFMFENPRARGYDVGVYVKEDGSMEFRYDSYNDYCEGCRGNSIENDWGKGLNGFLKATILEVAISGHNDEFQAMERERIWAECVTHAETGETLPYEALYDQNIPLNFNSLEHDIAQL